MMWLRGGGASIATMLEMRAGNTILHAPSDPCSNSIKTSPSYTCNERLRSAIRRRVNGSMDEPKGIGELRRGAA
jgi:hypothetical protein